MNRLLKRVVVAMLLGVAVYAAFALYTGFDRMAGSLGSFRWSSFALALLLSSFNYLLRFGKWQYYLRRLGVRGVRPFDSLLVFLSGFVLTVTPGKVGEVFKSAVLAKTHGVPAAQTAPIVIADRLTDVIAIVILIMIGSTTFQGGFGWAIAGTLAVGCGLLAILWQTPTLAALSFLAQRRGFLGRIAPKLVEAYASLADAGRAGGATVADLAVGDRLGCGSAGALPHRAGLRRRAPARALDVFLFDRDPGWRLDSGARRPRHRRGHDPRATGAAEAVAEGSATASMMLIRFATLWWSVALGFAALGWLRLRFPRELGGDTALPAAAVAPGED